MKTKIKILCVSALSLFAALSCGKVDEYSQLDLTKVEFLKTLGCEVGENQMWKTAVTLNIDVQTDIPAEIWLYTQKKNEVAYLVDNKKVASSGVIQMTIPQGFGLNMNLVYSTESNRGNETVSLTGESEQSISLKIGRNRSVVEDTSKTRTTRADASLYGYSFYENAIQREYTKEQLESYFSMIERMHNESVPAESYGDLVTDYELQSNGPFYITWMTGNCSSNTPHVLGYYYHSPGSYEDIKYVDLSETEIYDYIDGMAKVQYKVSSPTAESFGILPDKWYDANFDMNDRWDMTPNLSARAGDDAWNSMAVYERYGRNISAMRGISFEVDVPVGMRIGFYDRVDKVASTEQYEQILKLGVRPQYDQENFKVTNFTAAALNLNTKGSYRSFIKKENAVYWLGMENNSTGGDLDCNDVIFGVTADLEIYRPDVVIPDIGIDSHDEQPLPWTIAFEDVYRTADFDFNDAVIRLEPDYDNERCCIYALACGTEAKMYLHYDGPDGDQYLGEMHQLLTGNSMEPACINTTSSIMKTSEKAVDCVPWPSTYSMKNDANRFYIEVVRGDCLECSNVIRLAQTPGLMPEALLVAGEWQWPKEGVNVQSAYADFSRWAEDEMNSSYWNWYSNPTSNTTVQKANK